MHCRHGRVTIIAAALGAALCGDGPAAAQVTIERGASLLVFPKIIANGTRDTLVQISNASNSMVRAH